jgi:hypothetical protein
MINTIFYTFSTIAQTLAGAIALLGAFVLYQLQSLRSEIERDSYEIVEKCRNTVDTQTGRGRTIDWYRAGEYRRIAEIPIEHMAVPDYALTHIVAIQAQLSRNLDQRDSLLKPFKKSLQLTVWLIFFSLVALISACLISRSDILCWFVLIGGLLWFGICLYSYIVLMQRAIE